MRKFIVIIAFLLILLPSVSQASLIPCGTEANPQPCTICHFIVGIYGLINYGKTILIIVALAAIVIAGIIYTASAGNSKMMEQSKSFILSVALGCVFFLGAWLIITITLRILSAKPNFGVTEATNWYTFTCDTTSSAPSPTLPPVHNFEFGD